MGLKQILKESFAQLRTSVHSVLQRISPQLSYPFSLSGPQPLRSPWEVL